ncbi:MAG: dockerin type I domain-containing protein [Eubacteriales bacterium]
MKKRVLIAIVISAMAVFAAAGVLTAGAGLVTVYDRNENIALGKPYEASAAYTQTPAGMGYQDIDGEELTDGILSTGDLYATCWHGFDYRIESPLFATVDLGSRTDGLIEFRMQFINHANSGIDAPESLEFLSSDDGETFTPLGSGKEETKGGVAFYRLKLKSPVSARYIKAAIGNPKSGVFVFCSEFEIYNSVERLADESELTSETSELSEEVSEVPDPRIDITKNLAVSDYPPEFRAGSRYAFSNSLLTGARPGDTAASVLKDLKTIAGIKILGGDGKELTNGGLYTGCVLAQYSGKKAVSEHVVFITGDIDGNAGVTESDAQTLKSQILKNKKPSGILKAGDINQNGLFDVTDYIAVRLHALGKADLFTETPAPPDITAVKVKYTSLRSYSITTTASNGKKLTLTFDKKDWGTWNLGSLGITGLSLVPGSTDWEYVYRAAKTSSSEVVWSGGNHGNESLVSLAFYNMSTGEELTFDKIGAEQNASGLIIVEKTKLNWGNTEDYYCDAVRTYYIADQKITLGVSYDFIKDCYYNLSYTCMFPVPKTLGLYIDFLNDNGTVRTVETLKVGAADYTGPMHNGNAATACKIYGYQNTEYSFLVQVYTKADSLDGFKNAEKTFFWDMNATQNKLYFSKFSNDFKTKVDAGTHWDTLCSWEVLIDSDK